MTGHTKGEWKADMPIPTTIDGIKCHQGNMASSNGQFLGIIIGKSPEEQRANSSLITDAGNTATKTGLLPSQLLEQRDQLFGITKDTLIKFYNYIQDNDIDHNIPQRIENMVVDYIVNEILLIDNEPEQTPITLLELTARAEKSLYLNDLEFIEQIDKMHPSDLIKFSGIGKETAYEIYRKIMNYYLNKPK